MAAQLVKPLLAPTRREGRPPAPCQRLLNHDGACGPPSSSAEDALLALYGRCAAVIPRRR